MNVCGSVGSLRHLEGLPQVFQLITTKHVPKESTQPEQQHQQQSTSFHKRFAAFVDVWLEMKVKTINRNEEEYTKERSQDLKKVHRNYDPSLHQFQVRVHKPRGGPLRIANDPVKLQVVVCSVSKCQLHSAGACSMVQQQQQHWLLLAAQQAC